jgi:vacuolar protein sorting-associated protein 13A/C
VVTQNVLFLLGFKDLGMFFCIMNDRKETELRFLDNCNATFSLDDRTRPDGIVIYHVSLEVTRLLFRLSYRDIFLLNGLTNRLIQGASSTSPENNIETGVSQKFRLYIEGIKGVFIDDNIHLPIFEFGLDRTLYEISNWSSKVFTLYLMIEAI